MTRRLRSALSLPSRTVDGVGGRPRALAAAGSAAAPGDEPVVPGPLVLDLIAVVVESGAHPQAALRSVGASLSSAGDPRGEQLVRAATRLGHAPASDSAGAAADRLGDLGQVEGGLAATVEEVLALAARSGLPPTALIRRAAAEQRRRQLSAQLKAVRRLEVLLVIPAGLCLLPAFVLLGIVPLVVRLIIG